MNYQSVYTYLNEHGIKPGTNGYDYLASSIVYVSGHPNARLNEACRHTALQFGVCPERVDGCMRYALKNMPVKKPREFIRTAARNISRKEGKNHVKQ